jgi:hypothetical protein
MKRRSGATQQDCDGETHAEFDGRARHLARKAFRQPRSEYVFDDDAPTRKRPYKSRLRCTL